MKGERKMDSWQKPDQHKDMEKGIKNTLSDYNVIIELVQVLYQSIRNLLLVLRV